ncbi:archaellin/type IV pilin N-terminal domain-containing protein [Stygiolobus azoricus]|uniref:Uncharacterized protein n=1 Tax=Stygiolobus azoricus TaxID=41675 RepID=A0A650CN67_9CREN|nr:archaellin/type IV pilin N-terminal domain-containing protein [Stygiolobus azoricus]QGR19279.1 hypothetical protein D1868_04310 [Stygiolobus azoricus]
MRSKKGISSILGAVILVQIIIMSLLLVLSVEKQLGSSSQNLITRLNYYSQNSPLSIIEINGSYYITSPSKQYICYVIYPNELKPIRVKISVPVSINSILLGHPWAIIITNKGTWYNITSLGIYSDTGNKLYSLQQLVSIAGIPYNGSFPIPQNASPDWGYLRGINTPDPFALVPLNLTKVLINYTNYNFIPIGKKINYSYAITDTILKIDQAGQYQWINLTFQAPSPKFYFNSLFWSDVYYLGGLYLPVHSETKNSYNIGYIYYAIYVVETAASWGGGPFSLGPYTLIESTVSSAYSYYGNINYNLGWSSTALEFNPNAFYPQLFQVDINLHNLTVYYYVAYGTSYYPNGLLNKWDYIGYVKFTNVALFNNSPLYIAIPKGVYLLNVST